ncbi:MAG: HEPN domain-containing protein [Pyrobaculum sp.]
MDLIEKAEGWYDIARLMLSEGRHWAVCFAAHQAVELYLKGLLLKRVGAYPFTHNLVQLVKALGVDVPPHVIEACSFLNPHYTTSRYGAVALYDEDTARICFEKATQVLQWARSL